MEKTFLDDNVSVEDVEKVQVTNDETSYVHVCTECDRKNEPITTIPDENPHRIGRGDRWYGTAKGTSNGEIRSTDKQSNHCGTHERRVLLQRYDESRIEGDWNSSLDTADVSSKHQKMKALQEK